MARKANEERMEQVYQAVQEYPGERPGVIARLLGLNNSEVTRILPSMEENEYYLAEDEKGGLWPFKCGEKHRR
jgi:DNA-binding IclR family transcriptional regulator